MKYDQKFIFFLFTYLKLILYFKPFNNLIIITIGTWNDNYFRDLFIRPIFISKYFQGQCAQRLRDYVIKYIIYVCNLVNGDMKKKMTSER